MQEYSYIDFLNTLNETDQFVLTAINEHINLNYPQYKPFDIKPMDKSAKNWKIHYRKKPKIGKAICNIYSFGSKLSVHFAFLSSMTHEFLLKQSQFSDKIKNIALKQMVCAVNNSCRNYRGNNVCAWRQFYCVNTRLLITCHYPWVSFDDCNENDIADIKQLIDIQIKHMVQDSKEIKGASYTEVNTQKCGEVKTKFFNEINLDIDVFKISDHVKKLNDLKNILNCTILFQWGKKTDYGFI